MNPERPAAEQKKEFNPEHLFGYQNPNLEKYQVLFDQLSDRSKPIGERFEDMGDTASLWGVLASDELIRRRYSEIYDGMVKVKNYILDKLQGNILVDLGGRMPRGNEGPYNLCKGKDITFITIDLFMAGVKEGKLWDKFENGVFGMRGDMLLTLARMKTGSVNVTINGIDHTIIPNESYHTYLASEIERVCLPGGFVFGRNAPSLQRIKEKVVKGESRDFKIMSFGIDNFLNGYRDCALLEKVS